MKRKEQPEIPPRTVVAEVLRYDPLGGGAPRYDSFTLTFEGNLTVFNLLQLIYETQDGSLGFRNNRCGYGTCGVCQVRVNGKIVRACKTLVREDRLRIEPVDLGQTLRDLAVVFT